MAGSVGDFLVGGLAIAASFVAAPLGLEFLAAPLFVYGTGRVMGGISKLRNSAENRIEGAKLNVRSTQSDLPVIYGVNRVGLKIVDTQLADNPTDVFPGAGENDVLVRVGALCLGSEDGSGIQEISEIRLYNDGFNTVPNPGSFGLPPANTDVIPKYDEHLKYTLESGTDVQTADSVLVDALDWDAFAHGRGIAYGAFYLRWDPAVWAQGVPQITAKVVGNRVYDPRTSTWIGYSESGASSDNPALCILDYLTSKRYGGAAPYAARDGGTEDVIDEDSFIDAANYFDESVSTPGFGTERRFRMNAIVSTSRVVGANLAEMLATCRGELVWQGGKYRLVVRRVTLPEAFELTEDNIVGEIEWTRKGSSVPNVIEATFPDGEDGDYVANSVLWPLTGDTTLIDEDGGVENRIEVELPYTTSYYQALRTIMVMLREARNDQLVNLTATQEAYRLQVGHVVAVTHSGPGWDQQLFWVRQIALTPDGLVRLALQQYSDSAYALDTLTARPATPTTNLPDPFTVAAPTGVTAVSNSSTAASLGNGAYQPRIQLSWTESLGPFLHHYQVQVRQSLGPGAWLSVPDPLRDDVSCFIEGVDELVDYDVRIRAVNSIGVFSDWVQVDDHTVVGLPLPRFEQISYNFNEADELIVSARTAEAGAVRFAAGASRPLDATVDAALLAVTDTDGLVEVNLGSGFPTDVIVAGRAYENADGTGLQSEVQVAEVFKVVYIEATGGHIGGWDIGATDLSAGNFRIESDTERMLLGLATAPLTGVGIFIGLDGVDYELRAGDPAGDYIHWDGTDLVITGEITATAGEIGGWEIAPGEITSGGGGISLQADAERILVGLATAPLVGEGVFIGFSGGIYQARFGDPSGDYLLWDGSNIIIGGAVVDGGTNIIDDSIITAKINDAAVTTAKMADRSVDLDKLFLGSFDNLVLNPGFEQGTTLPADGWRLVGSPPSGVWTVETTAPRTGLNHAQYDATLQASTNAGKIRSQEFAVAEGDSVYAEIYGRIASGTGNRFQIAIVWNDGNGDFLSSSAGSATDATTSYAKLTSNGAAPAGAAICSVEVRVLNDGLGGVFYFDDCYVRRMVSGDIVVEDTIVARHIAALAIEAEHLAARSVSAPKLFVGNFDNLVMNGGFEASDSLDGWEVIADGGSGGSWILSEVNPRSGIRCATFDPEGAQTGSVHLCSPGNSAAEGLAVTPGDKIYVEGYARLSGAGTTQPSVTDIRIRFYETDGSFISNPIVQRFTAGELTSSYQKLSGIVTAPANASYMLIALVVGTGGDYVIKFDDIYARRAVEGSIVVDGTLTALHIESLSFSGKNAEFDTGSIGGWLMTAGTLHSGNVTIDSANRRITMGAASAPLTGIGIFMGEDEPDNYEFRVGDPSGDYVHFDGSTLDIQVTTFVCGTDAEFNSHVYIDGGAGDQSILHFLVGGVEKGSIGYDAVNFDGGIFLLDGGFVVQVLTDGTSFLGGNTNDLEIQADIIDAKHVDGPEFTSGLRTNEVTSRSSAQVDFPDGIETSNLLVGGEDGTPLGAIFTIELLNFDFGTISDHSASFAEISADVETTDIILAKWKFGGFSAGFPITAVCLVNGTLRVYATNTDDVSRSHNDVDLDVIVFRPA